MGAIRPHKTAVDKSGNWDGPAAVADAPNDAAVLRYMHAWVDDDGDPEAKQSYKFPHHRPGTDTPAVISAVNNALARLPTANIPEADKPAVERHLRKHRSDAGLENDGLNESLVEQRSYAVKELRIMAQDDDGQRYIEGYAAVFNQWSEDLGGFVERILPGAFSDAIQTGVDVRALINHNPDLVLGRTTAGTLELSEDEVGLRVRIHLPETQYARDLLATMERGDVNQMSFGFSVMTGGDRWSSDGDITRREIVKIERLYDVSVVTFPAYPQTAATARDVLHMHYPGAAPVQAEGTPGEDAEAETARASLELKRKRLELYKKLGG